MSLYDSVRTTLADVLNDANFRLKIRRGNTSAWVVANPVLSAGEPGFDLDTRVLKIGDGSTPWSLLEPAQSHLFAPLALSSDALLAAGSDGRYYPATSAGFTQGTDGRYFFGSSNASARVVVGDDGRPYPVAT